MTDSASLVERIDAARFTPTRFSAGYGMRVIDALLDDLRRRASEGERLSPAMPEAAPDEVRVREAYKSAEVREFLRELLVLAGEQPPGWVVGAPGAADAADATSATAQTAAQSPSAQVAPAAGGAVTARGDASLAERIDHVRFTPTRFSPGYEMGAIDTLLDELSRRVSAGEPVAPGIPAAEVQMARFREAYVAEEVRRFLRSVLEETAEAGPAWLYEPDEAGERAGDSGTVQTSASRTPAASHREDDGGHDMPGREDPRGFFGRLFGG